MISRSAAALIARAFEPRRWHGSCSSCVMREDVRMTDDLRTIRRRESIGGAEAAQTEGAGSKMRQVASREHSST